MTVISMPIWSASRATCCTKAPASAVVLATLEPSRGESSFVKIQTRLNASASLIARPMNVCWQRNSTCLSESAPASLARLGRTCTGSRSRRREPGPAPCGWSRHSAHPGPRIRQRAPTFRAGRVRAEPDNAHRVLVAQDHLLLHRLQDNAHRSLEMRRSAAGLLLEPVTPELGVRTQKQTIITPASQTHMSRRASITQSRWSDLVCHVCSCVPSSSSCPSKWSMGGIDSCDPGGMIHVAANPEFGEPQELAARERCVASSSTRLAPHFISFAARDVELHVHIHPVSALQRRASPWPARRGAGRAPRVLVQRARCAR